MKFRLIEGMFAQYKPGAKQHPVSRDIETESFRKGDVIEPTRYDPVKDEVVSDPSIDLCKKFNVSGFAPKFERLHESVAEASAAGFNTAYTDVPGETPRQKAEKLRKMAAELEASDPLPLAPQPDPTIDGMTADELKKLAAEEEIELPKGVSKREDVLRLVKLGLSKRVGARS